MEVDTLKALGFKEKLVNQGRAFKAPDLVKKLTNLHNELKLLEQETVDKASLNDVSKDLIHNQLIKHDNKAVKILTACCLADILRLFAPDAPYSNTELKLKLLASPNDPNFASCFYLLESLSIVKSIIIIADLDNSERLSSALFSDFFNIIRSDLPRNVQVCMTDILVQISQEVGPLSQETVELLLEQFTEENKIKNDAAYTMAIDVCRTCTDILQRRVCQYFSDTLMAVSRSDGSQEDLDELKKVHELIRRVHFVVPNLLLNVVPQMVAEMTVDEYNVRQIAIPTIGRMIIEEGPILLQRYPEMWKTWLGRRNDIATQIRLQWLETCEEIYTRHAEIIPELDDCLKEKLMDPEEKIRAAACKAIGNVPFEAISQYMDISVLEQVASRCKDKRGPVRKEAMNALGSIYNCAYTKISAHDKSALDKFGWIPNGLFNCLYCDDIAIISMLESTLLRHIFPTNTDDIQRTDRLVTVIASLESRAERAFSSLIQRQKSFMEHMQHRLIGCCITKDDMDVDSATAIDKEALMKHMSGLFGEKSRTLSCFRRIAETEDNEISNLLEIIINPTSDYKRIIKSKQKLLARLEQLSPAIAEVFDLILNRAAPLILNKSSIPHLHKILRNTRGRRHYSGHEPNFIAQEILKKISTLFPAMYGANAQDLVKNILNEPTGSTAEDDLEILAQVSKNCSVELKLSKNAVDRLSTYILDGTRTQAEYAATILSNMNDAVNICVSLIESLCNNLAIEQRQLSTLTGLSQFARYIPKLLSEHIESVFEFIQQHILSQQTLVKDDMDSEWVEYEELLDLSKRKIAAVQLLVNYTAGLATLEQEEDSIAQRTFTILWELLDVTCDDAFASHTSAPETSHLRLLAAKSIVKLTHISIFENRMSVLDFERIGLTLQIKSFIQRRAGKLQIGQRVSDLEIAFTQLIHLIAHHPDYSVTTEELLDFSRYIEFYLSCVATVENVSFLYQVAQKIKSSKDAVSEELSQNSYVLSDLACLLIKRQCKNVSWPLNAYSQHISLQSRLYKSLPSSAVQTETMRTNYLPEDLINTIEADGHRGTEKRGQMRLSAATASKRIKTE
ncbi:hypothetical protein EC973_006936 [Apophysomyces ossiformis]|uniref:Uncharacterized protein n=1 Tax=Apophysomyces ossiformis TaxID=679940 RepID=A0A8H7BQC2_9FUNG|nr:hypothetical protein EC973_006936 [Apophysomyces ossiformis]